MIGIPVYLVGTIITLVLAGFTALMTMWKLTLSQAKAYTDQKVNEVERLHGERIMDLKKDIKELKEEVKELRNENKEQTTHIIKLITLSKKK